MAFPTGVKAYWKLEDVNDALGVYNLTNSNVTFSTGKINNGAVFNGTNAKLLSTTPVTQYGSWSFWFKTTTAIGYGALVGKNASGHVHRTAVIDGYVYFNIIIGGVEKILTSSGTYNDGSWHHVVAVWGASGMELYVDNTSVASNSEVGYDNTATNLTFGVNADEGGGGDTWWLDGSIDEVGVWDRAITSDEVSALYNSGNGASDYLTLAGVSYWKLDESSGDASDSVGSRTLTNNGTTTYTTGKLNNCASFNGSSQFLSRSAEALGIANVWTVSTWAKCKSTGSVTYIARWRPGSGDANEIRLTKDASDKFNVTVIHSSGSGTGYKNYYGSTVMSSDVWYHLSLTWNGTSLILYVNGTAESLTKPTDGTLSMTNDSNRIAGIGGWNSTVYGDVYVDELGIWSRALTAGEVLALYNAGDGQAYPLDTVVGVSDKITTTSDDCFDDATNIDLDGASELIIGQHPSLSFEYTGGFRFKNLNIPQGATIVEAKITMVNQGNSNGTPSFLIKGEDADDSATFSTHADFVGRSRTTASVAWTPGTQTSGTVLTTVDIKDVVQEIVDRVGWSSGNDMGFFIENNGSHSLILVYDYTGGASYAAQIQIAYSIGTAYELLCAVTAYTLTGINTIFNKAISIILTAGSFTLTGIDILINTGKGMVCSVANFILTGLNINIRGAGSWKWRNGTKNTIDAGDITNETKTVVSATNETKNNSTWVNDSK